ncbi:growth hormone-regulated TBC protein 1-A isoform X2 [Nematostella vectensis]|uniref:growth hormone-regulated TBC protein 1-A isoform X2 n=1 Tax=Nematostella vectensis TaxID=45351 RepID=UPI00207735F2|nr:growth hormone-regulated TBC protein 1-A isoform X2 [Nematostella vectensis]
MSTIESPVDEYGFHRPDDFDYKTYSEFMSSYIRILAHRATRWGSVLKGSSKVKKSRKIKRFVRKGVPSSHRAQVWMDISGARKRMKKLPGYYQSLLESELDDIVRNSILTDIDRTFPENIYFGSSSDSLKQKLKNILVAYAVHNPKIGYCQGLNYIAGLLLLIIKTEEPAFWLLEAMMMKRLPDYYAKDMMGLQVEQEVLSELVNIFSTKWFICLYIDVLPVETVLRIWDSLFYEGSKILLRVAITLLALHQDKLLAAKDFPQLCNVMKDITTTPSTMDCHSFMTNCFELPGSLPRRLVSRLRREAHERLKPGEGQNGK